MKELEDSLHGDALTAWGTTVSDNLANTPHPPEWQDVIKIRERRSWKMAGSLVCLET